jgi:radical SAM superfamily enzyme YgiQ (UPF0313 family)
LSENKSRYNVGLVQPNFSSGPKYLNAYYLPYSIGMLWTYANTNEKIKKSYNDHTWIFRREPIDDVVDKLTECDIVFFSLYVWNKKYCFEIAKRLKKNNNKIYCVFGGPEVPHNRSDLFLKYPFIDTVVIGEGERAILEILLKFLDNAPIERLVKSSRIKDLNLPSPYLEGVFDKLMKEHPDIEWMPTLETDRGCPYKCTFCDWGSLTSSKVTKFDLHRVYAELEWIAEKKLPFLTMTSANFGIFRERDNLIADKIVELKQKHGVPSGISTSYAKNSNADVFNIIKKFSAVGIQSGFILSLQTATLKSLEAIKRTNMDINDISEIANRANQAQLPVFTEVILGLPLETHQSFKISLMKIIDSGLHNGLDIFLLNMIENAPMQEDIKKYDLKTFTAYDMFYETEESADISTAEGIEVVKSTSTMSQKDIFDSYIYAWYVLGLHTNGISDIAAKYCNKDKICTYSEFYKDLIPYMIEHTSLKIWHTKLESAYKDWTRTGYFNLRVEDKNFISWQIIHSMMVIVQITKVLPEIINTVSTFLKLYYNIPEELINDYKVLTTERIKTWDNYKVTPKKISTFTNLWEYIQNTDEEIEFLSHEYFIKDRFNHFPGDFSQHLDNIIYGRRRNWILNLIDDRI